MNPRNPTDPRSPDSRPLISCLMVTRQRPAMAKRAIDCFGAQDYSPRELVIVSDGYEEYEDLREYGTRVCGPGLVMSWADRGARPLGELRNQAVELARGDVICQWDDDDLSHPRRLSAQFEQMCRDGAGACFMTEYLQLFMRTRSLYWCDWTRSRGLPLPSPTLPGTLMCYKRVAPAYPETGPLSRRSGDAYVMRSLLKSERVARLSGLGWLYVYVSHSSNIWDESHHLDIVRATGIDAGDLARRRQELCTAMTTYALGSGIVVRDYLGSPVFALNDPSTA
jgi:glycosyltransferase involved in cell wall biosynthesis